MGEGGIEGEGHENPFPNVNMLGGGMGIEGEWRELWAHMRGGKGAPWEGCACVGRERERGHQACKHGSGAGESAGDTQGEHMGCPQGVRHWGKGLEGESASLLGALGLGHQTDTCIWLGMIT